MTLMVVLVAAGLVGCADEPSGSSPAPADDYVAAAERLLMPIGSLASVAAGRAQDPDAPAPARERLDEMALQADRALAAFRALRVDDPGLRAQQRRLVERYEAIRTEMDDVIDSLAAGDDPPALARAAAGFFDAVEALPAGLAEGP